MIDDSDAVEVGAHLGQALEQAGHAYAIGGALAYGFFGIPRATQDVDLNVFVETDQLEAVFDTMATAGVAFDPTRARAEAAEQGMFIGRFQQMRIDVFVPSIPFSWEAAKTRVRRTIAGEQLWFLSAEAITIFKLLFFRGKDLVDLERLVSVQGRRLDAAYVRRHLVEMMGEDDVRVSKWDELVRDFAPR